MAAMERMLRVYGLPVAIVGWLLTLPATAHAYLDPGTGSMLLQLLLGGAAGLAIAAKLYWHNFLSALGLRKVRNDERTDEKDEPAAEVNARGSE
jgi:hypothetical protein